MRESFVFHADFIDHLPEEYKTEWSLYVINYGLYGEEPVFDNPLIAELWRKIKDRIDGDQEAYNKKAETSTLYNKYKKALKNREIEEGTTFEEFRDNLNISNNLNILNISNISNNYTDTQREYVSVSDSVYVNEYVSVSDEEKKLSENVDNSVGLTTTTLLNHFLEKKGLKITPYSHKKIKELLEVNNFDEGFLNYVLENVKAKYPDKNEKEIALLFSKAVSWEDLQKNYKSKPKQAKKEKLPKCTVCGASLQHISLDTAICPVCRQKGVRTVWEKIGNEWVQSQTA